MSEKIGGFLRRFALVQSQREPVDIIDGLFHVGLLGIGDSHDFIAVTVGDNSTAIDFPESNEGI